VTAKLLLIAALATGASAEDAIWIDVPFVAQPREGCGAASLAMVIQYWERQLGHATSQISDANYIQRVMYSPGAHGIYASDLESYLRQHGFRSYAFRGDLELLRQHLAKGRPLIVALKPSRQSLLHYVVVDGIELSQGTVSVNDPAQRKLLKMESSRFEHAWLGTRNWTLLALPQSDAP